MNKFRFIYIDYMLCLTLALVCWTPSLHAFDPLESDEDRSTQEDSDSDSAEPLFRTAIFDQALVQGLFDRAREDWIQEYDQKSLIELLKKISERPPFVEINKNGTRKDIKTALETNQRILDDYYDFIVEATKTITKMRVKAQRMRSAFYFLDARFENHQNQPTDHPFEDFIIRFGRLKDRLVVVKKKIEQGDYATLGFDNNLDLLKLREKAKKFSEQIQGRLNPILASQDRNLIEVAKLKQSIISKLDRIRELTSKKLLTRDEQHELRKIIRDFEGFLPLFQRIQAVPKYKKTMRALREADDVLGEAHQNLEDKIGLLPKGDGNKEAKKALKATMFPVAGSAIRAARRLQNIWIEKTPEMDETSGSPEQSLSKPKSERRPFFGARICKGMAAKIK